MTLPTTIREELANLRALAAGIVDGCATIEALLPVEPPPVLPSLQLHAEVTTLTAEAPEVMLDVVVSEPSLQDIKATLTVTRIDQNSPVSIQLVWGDITIRAGQLYASTPVRVTQLPEAGQAVTFDVELTGADGATIGEASKVTFRVDGPPVPPPPELPVATLSITPPEITEEAPEATVTVTLSMASELDVSASVWVATDAIGTHTFNIPAGTLSQSETIRISEFPSEDSTLKAWIDKAIGATFTADAVATAIVRAKAPPPPEPLHVSLWADADKLNIAEEGGKIELFAKTSRPVTEDTWIPLVYSGTATRDLDYIDEGTYICVLPGHQEGSIFIEAIADRLVEGDETIVVAIEPSDAYVIDQGSVLITITDDDEPPPPPPPDPDPNPPAYTVRAAHPRMYLLDEQIPEAQAKLKAAPAVLTALIKQADAESTASNGPFDRTLSCAILWRLGLGKDTGIKSKYTVAEHRARAIDNLIRLCANPINLAGNHFDLNHLEPVAWGYDWLWNELTEDQRATVRARIVEALEASWNSTSGNDRLTIGYNAHSGLGMLLALAIHGETETDWVARYWNENWWLEPTTARGGLWNRQFEKMLNGPGNNEDWLYCNNHAGLFACRHAWETATGDTKSLDLPWFTEFTLLHLHQGQADPIFNTSGVQTGSRWRMLPTSCSGGGNVTAGQAHIFKGESGAGGWRAGLGAWMAKQANHATRPAAEEFLFQCVIGDPRVPAQSPAELNLPLDYHTGGTGFVYSRASWDRNAPCMRFACSEYAYRATGVGDFSIWAGGLPLICHRSNLYDHGYAGLGRLTLPQIIDPSGKLISAVSGDGTRIRDPIASLTHTPDGWHIADLSRLWGKAVSKMTRAVKAEWDSPTSGTVQIVDECVCKDGYKPVSTWGTPLLPFLNVNDDPDKNPGYVGTFTNGVAKAVMMLDSTPAMINVRGGETGDEMARDLDGTLYNVGGLATFKRLSRDQQIAAGGYYTVYTFPTLSDGAWRLVTTIRVQA